MLAVLLLVVLVLVLLCWRCWCCWCWRCWCWRCWHCWCCGASVLVLAVLAPPVLAVLLLLRGLQPGLQCWQTSVAKKMRGCLLDQKFFLLGCATVYLSQPKESPMGEQAVQHCQLIAGDSNREEQARHHEHPRTATAGQGGCGSFPSLNLPALQMH